MSVYSTHTSFERNTRPSTIPSAKSNNTTNPSSHPDENLDTEQSLVSEEATPRPAEHPTLHDTQGAPPFAAMFPRLNQNQDQQTQYTPPGQGPLQASGPQPSIPECTAAHMGRADPMAAQHPNTSSINQQQGSSVTVNNWTAFGCPTRPHPHLIRAQFYINSYPANLPEMALARAIPDCLPMRINLRPPVPEDARLMPDMHYDWMPKSGTIEFFTLGAAERALAVLANHTSFAPLGVWFSPYPPPAILPSPEPYVSGRYIRPTQMAVFPILPSNPTPEQTVAAYFPTPSELYDAVRPWGSIRLVNTWIQETADEKVDGRFQWLARVDFWHEDEARRFESGFGATGSLLKGWQVYIWTSDPQPITPYTPMGYPSTGSMHGGHTTVLDLPTPAISGHGMPPLPHTPPPISYTPPWAAHNMFAGMPEGYVDRTIVTTTPVSAGRRMSKTSSSSLNGRRQRNWCVTVGESPDGGIRPTGLVADDGTFIQHGPGQHIRPAPPFGPGSTSASGLVDYSNVFVKNLDPDITSYYLEEIFGHLGRVISARVMRDEYGRSRGYGFVSFYTPEQAANAIQVMNGTTVGSQQISVTLHEPRKLRPEKIAEKAVHGLPTTLGRHDPSAPRRSMSPIRTFKTGRSRRPQGVERKSASTTEDLRLLSPNSHKSALKKRIRGEVRTYLKIQAAPEQFTERIVNALLHHDLELIPMLYNREQLEARMAEALGVVSNQADDAVADSADLVSVSPNLHKGHIANSLSSSQARPTSADVATLREEIEKIDPVNVEEVTSILKDTVKAAEWAERLGSKSNVALQYGVAMRILQSRRAEADTNTAREAKPEEFDRDQDEHDPKLKTYSPDTDLNDSTKGSLPLEDITLPSLAVLSAKQIMKHIVEQGPNLLDHSGIVEPTPAERSNLSEWKMRLTNKTAVERKGEIAVLLGRKISVEILKRSQEIKVIADLVNAEEEEPLCDLTLYPVLLNAKVKAFVDARHD
ncbi:hypothetical protein IAR55_000405 [Kwoniella newhampshirensis]|uniref:RRM domain-containing protein n=1 Tax=Kwoniella newhampshirensis TaxID=1651941 RepID=A0AAW0Z6K4_9TREE